MEVSILKKQQRNLPRVRSHYKKVKHAFIHVKLGGYPLSIVCRVFGVTQAGYHASQANVPSPRENKRDALRASIRSVFEAERGRYGAPRIFRVLCARYGYSGSLNRIQAPKRAMGLRANAGSKYKVTTDSGHSLPVAINLLGQDFGGDTSADSISHAKAPDQVWLSDIT